MFLEMCHEIIAIRQPGQLIVIHAPQQLLQARLELSEQATGRFTFRAGGLVARLEGELSCAPGDLIRAHYHDPDGEERWNHFTAIGDLRLTLSRRVRGRWQVTEQLTAPRRAAFEIAGPTADPAVTCDHVAVS
jgi:hypothetical protein